MKRLLIGMFLCLLFSPHSSSQTRRALVIGIGEYPSESGWWQIHGDRDVPIVCDMLHSSGFMDEDIKCLKNSQATKSGITAALSDISASCRPGDIVFIHFSGHGQQVEDLNGDEKNDLQEPYDESWIPYDAHREYRRGVYEGENHLLDDEINLYLHNIRSAVGKQGKILVSVDACHSGGSTRGPGDSLVCRGTSDIFIYGDNPHPRYSLSGDFSQEWVVISACKSYQTNFETKEGTGRLSSALQECTDEFCTGSYQSLFSSLEQVMKTYKSPVPQTPQLDGSIKFTSKVL